MPAAPTPRYDPSVSAPSGWYVDPAGSGRHRYFDGSSWTSFYGNLVSQPPSNPTRGTQSSNASAPFAPSTPAPKARSEGGSAVAALVTVVVLVALVGGGIAIYRHFYPPRDEKSYQEGYQAGSAPGLTAAMQGGLINPTSACNDLYEVMRGSAEFYTIVGKDWFAGCHAALGG
jgi:hypothetical protein